MAKKPTTDKTAEAAPVDETETPEIPKKERDRQDVLDNIDATRRADLAEAGVEIDEPEAEAEAEAEDVAAGAADTETPAEADTGEEEAAAAADDTPAEPMVTIVVDGQEREVKQSELVANYQKNSAADARLAQANETLDAALAMRDATAAPAADAQPAAVGQPAAPAEDSANPLDAIDWQGAVNKLQFGNEEEGAGALRALVEEVSAVNAQQGVSIDIEATQREIEQRVSDGQEWKSALASFGKDYGDIIKDPYLQTLTAQRASLMFDEAIQESVRIGKPQRPSYDAIFKAAGDETRKWVKTMRGESDDVDDEDEPQPNPSAVTVHLSGDRAEAKRKASALPKPRSVQKSKPAAGEAKPKTVEQIRADGIKETIAARERKTA